ncbi:nucleotidyltransferase domain-containing protein [Paenibacillus sp. cl6col]|uniref:nucleotidyltransferase domain-containing protein n=1 Tax=Paenibacillus sp. cl6col TaxID=1761878 RepID=UPI000B816FFF|nr:nucleotidyltransferase domain-containing protein [Paenibacillus sp. cl6col]
MELVNVLRRNRDNQSDRGVIQNESTSCIRRYHGLLKCELSQSLVGIYLHGSMAMGCFTPQQSDIDILTIVKDELPNDMYKIIAREIIRL